MAVKKKQLMMEEEEIVKRLMALQDDPAILTEPAFRANTDIWPDNEISFVDSHLAYLRARPSTNPDHYLSNLKLRLRKRT